MAKKVPTDRALQEAHRIVNPMCKRLYTLKEGAKYLGRSVWGMRELIWSGKIPVVKEADGRKIFIDVLDLESYVNQNKSIYR